MIEQHTPGPLIAGPESDDGVYGILVQSGHSIGYAKLEADAQLWAAAPELLQMVQQAVKLNSFREFNDHIPLMKSAIAKATGSSRG